MIHVVAGILQRNHKILVAERPAGKPYSGYWEFPGGKIEANETGQTALQRELQEELGITVISSQLWCQHSHRYPDRAVSLEIWRVIEFAGEPHGKEQQVLRWVSFQELLELKVLEGNLIVLDKLNLMS